MVDIGLFGLFLVAVALGFYLGWRARTRIKTPLIPFSRSYYQGLNYLLNEQVDTSVDMFIDSLEVNPDTLETHLALGNLLRRKGEVAKAIKIHQNLLARPSLGLDQMHQAQLELARDFIRAGLLDRAEGLLEDLVNASPHTKPAALEHLIEIYQDERDWAKAIQAANQLFSRRSSKPNQWLNVALGHFCCEMAQGYIDSNDVLGARRLLRQALSHDRQSVRASLMWASLEYAQGELKESLRLLQKIPGQDSDLIPEMLPLLRDIYNRQGDVSGLYRYLSQLQEQYPCSSLVIQLAELMRLQEGEQAAQGYLTVQLRRRPSVRVLSRLVDLHLQHSEGKARDNLLLLKGLLEQISELKPDYGCYSCGFTGNQLHWLCPGCKSWGTVKAIRGVEGE